MTLAAGPARLAGPPLDAGEPFEDLTAALARAAREAPGRDAVVAPDGRRASFETLDRRANRIARGLLAEGLRPGDRASVFVPAGIELVALCHGLLRAGIVPVLIDPGMGRRSLLACVERTAPRALLGVGRAQLARRLFPGAFRSVELAVTVGGRALLGGTTLAAVEHGRDDGALSADEAPARTPADLAAILFTSGSTGPPKGVEYTHGNFAAQLRALRALYALEPGERDAACFPLFALFDNALGMTSVFPRLDPTRMARADPAAVARAIEAERATFTFGSPAVWRRLVPWARERGFRFTRLTRVTIAGAPVPPPLVLALRALLPPGGEVHTPYGATEALPVASVSGAELDGARRERVESGEGTCVGRPAPGIEVRLIRPSDEPIDSWEEVEEAAPGEAGEVCVCGPVVTRGYADAPDATRRARIVDGSGRVWHRMGDVGVVDAEGLLWFHGRRAHRLETRAGTRMPVPLENVFAPLEELHRTALVGLGPRGSERPFLVVEPARGVARARALAAARRRAVEVPAAACIEGFLTHAAFPVDVRHNAKIHRLELKRWAEERRR